MKKNQEKNNQNYSGISLFDETFLGNNNGANNQSGPVYQSQVYIPRNESNFAQSNYNRTTYTQNPYAQQGYPQQQGGVPVYTESQYPQQGAFLQPQMPSGIQNVGKGLFVHNNDGNGNEAYIGGGATAAAQPEQVEEYRVRDTKKKLTKSKKIALCAYILIIGIIIFLIVLSTSGTSSADTGAADDSIVQEEAMSTINNVIFYDGKVGVTFESVQIAESSTPVVVAEEVAPTNWFDRLCDFIEVVVGG